MKACEEEEGQRTSSSEEGPGCRVNMSEQSGRSGQRTGGLEQIWVSLTREETQKL